MSSQGDADSDTLAFFAMTLGRMSRPQPELITDLWKNKNTLTAFGLSFLAAAHKESGSRPLESAVPLNQILEALRKEATETRDSATFAGSISGSWSFDSPTRKNAAARMAYAIADPANPMTMKFLRGLLDKRRDGLWGTTQGNVFGIMAIYYLVNAPQSGTGSGSRNIVLTIDGKRYETSRFTTLPRGGYSIQIRESELPSSTSRSLRIETPGSLYVTARGIYDMPINASFLAPKSNGFRFSRRFETLEGRSLGNEIALGSIVRVRLEVVNDGSRNYIAVEDLLPAGFEALNTSLLTTESIGEEGESEAARRTRRIISYRDFRDHRAAFYADELAAGTFEFVYYARATTAGTFFLPSSLAEAMYDPESFGTTGGGSLTVK
jgi:uncharacterized protein YfaS (alpha-2-macroglobulin family)